MAKKLPDRIETEEQYNEILARMVAGAKEIENPLLDADIRDKYLAVYNRMDRLIDEYRERGD
ncbi:hypothetical protein D3C77_815130 [compost metagenome]